MDEREHKDFLTGIAKEVGKLIVKPANLNRFRQQDRILVEQEKQALELGHLTLLSFPKDDMTECGSPPQASKYPIEKVLLAYYALFTVLHDCDDYRVDDIKINNGIWSEDERWVRWILECELNWHYVMGRHVGNRLRAYIELALEHVKTDLAKKPTEKGRNITPAKEEKSNVKIHISGGIQAENVQIGNHASIHKEVKANEQNKSPLIRLLQFLGWLWTQLKWLWTIFLSK